MTKKEYVLKTLKNLIEKELPQVLIEENKRHNDGIVLENITGVVFDAKCLPVPYVRLTVKNAEHTEKDRILRIVKYAVDFEFVLVNSIDTLLILERYIEAFERVVSNRTNWYYCDILGTIENRLRLQIGV